MPPSGVCLPPSGDGRADRPHAEVKVMRSICWVFSLLIVSAAPPGRALLAADPVPLFDGKTLEGWTTLDGKPVTQGWEVVDGMIHLKKEGKRAGHIISARDVGDFILTFEWKIAPRGNSGLKYRVRPYGRLMLGCEYQIFDDEGSGKKIGGNKSAGSLYDLYEPGANKRLRPAGEFNAARIVVRGDRIEHWLNGERIVAATVGDPEWQRRIARSKFAKNKGFGEPGPGRIMLTDHGSEVWYRNIQFTPLPAEGDAAPAPSR